MQRWKDWGLVAWGLSAWERQPVSYTDLNSEVGYLLHTAEQGGRLGLSCRAASRGQVQLIPVEDSLWGSSLQTENVLAERATVNILFAHSVNIHTHPSAPGRPCHSRDSPAGHVCLSCRFPEGLRLWNPGHGWVHINTKHFT